MTIIFATGFEPGTSPFLASEISGTQNVGATSYTGSYGYNFGNSASVTKDYPTSTTTTSVACHIRPSTLGIFRIYFRFSDGGHLYIRQNSDTTFSFYLQGVLTETTTETAEINEWTHLEINLSADSVTGTLDFKINGHTVINYVGDTQPIASNNITTWTIGNIASGVTTIDNLVINDDGLDVGDVRFVALTPNADTATLDWIPSTGVTNYELVDEIPASDSDYVSTSTNGDQDLYEFTDFDSTGLTPQLLVLWNRARAETADGQQIKQLLKSGATLDISAVKNLQLDMRYFYEIYEADPNTGLAWTDSAIDAIQAGQEAVI